MSFTQTPHSPPSPGTGHALPSPTQQSAGQGSPVNPPSSPTVQIAEDQLGLTEAEAAYGSPAHSHYSGTSHSPTQPGSVSAELCSVETKHSPAPQELSQDITAPTQLCCSPTNLNIAQLDLSAQCSLVISAPSSPVPSSPEHRSTAEPTLDEQSRPGPSVSPRPSPPSPTLCQAEQEISTLDQGSLSPPYCSPTLPLRTLAVRAPLSAPCSPSRSPLRHTHCTRSQPASPTQISAPLSTEQTSSAELNAEAPSGVKVSPSRENQTLDTGSNLADLTPALDPPSASSPLRSPTPSPVSLEDSGVRPTPALPTSENLDQPGITSERPNNQASSTESGEMVHILTPASPASQSSHVSPSHVSAYASPSHASEMSAAPSPASISLDQDSPAASTVHMSPTHQASASSLKKSKSPSPFTATQDEQIEMPVATSCHSDSVQGSLIHGSSPQASPVHSTSPCVSPIRGEANVGTAYLSCSGGSPSHSQASPSSLLLVSATESIPVGRLKHVQVSCSSLHADQEAAIATPASASPVSADAYLVHSHPSDISPVSVSHLHSQTQVSPVNASCAGITTSPSAHRASSSHVCLPHDSPAHTHETPTSPTHAADENGDPCAAPQPSPPQAIEPCTGSPVRSEESSASRLCSPTPGGDLAPSPLHTCEPCRSPVHTAAPPSPLQVPPTFVQSTDCLGHRSSKPASPSHDSDSVESLRPMSSPPTQETTCTQDLTAETSSPRESPVSPLHSAAACYTSPIHASSPASTPIHASPDGAGSARSTPIHASLAGTSSPLQSSPARTMPPQTNSIYASADQERSSQSSPVNVASPVDVVSPASSSVQASPVRSSLAHPSPVHASPVHESCSQSSSIHVSSAHVGSPNASPPQSSSVCVSPSLARSTHTCPVHSISSPASPTVSSATHCTAAVLGSRAEGDVDVNGISSSVDKPIGHQKSPLQHRITNSQHGSPTSSPTHSTNTQTAAKASLSPGPTRSHPGLLSPQRDQHSEPSLDDTKATEEMKEEQHDVQTEMEPEEQKGELRVELEQENQLDGVVLRQRPEAEDMEKEEPPQRFQEEEEDEPSSSAEEDCPTAVFPLEDLLTMAGSTDQQEAEPEAAVEESPPPGVVAVDLKEGRAEISPSPADIAVASDSHQTQGDCSERGPEEHTSAESLCPETPGPRPSDDLSIRLTMSPFSTEPLVSTSNASLLPTTVVPLTLKIGMGKPAITKRKFSPGRPRVRQGTWWSNRRAVSPPSSSQDSTGEGGWSSPKQRPSDSPLWSMKVVIETHPNPDWLSVCGRH
ncbi:hypothetical protein NHX12_021471 [Muraenolepis orangiensis]|uniref:Uncharacterized protein n=1 Tax=Muraenolepis orangiensis TaxID=630683 RepID=A0A9Q0IW48_9TELE|nr:hypothetical protein NHX12_021471 [Muraenolepis orangiensis]